MSLRPEPLPPVPDATAAAVRAAFPKGNLSVDLRAAFGTLSNDQLFADLSPPEGRPVDVPPWRLALMMVRPYIAGLTARQAADAVRRCMDWQYALSLDLPDPGCDFTLLHDFRERLLAHDATQRLLDTFLTACKARGWINARGTQRTASTHVVAAIRHLHRLECVLEARPHALNQRREADPAWVRQRVPLAWDDRYGLRADRGRLPKETSQRDALARRIGADGYQLLEAIRHDERARSLRVLPALESLRQIWIQHYYRCTVPGLEDLRWRTTDERPPSAVLIPSPDELEARSCSKRETHWVGYTVHLTETCDPGQPDLITQVMTTPATTPDGGMGPTIQDDLAQRDLLPGTHLLDSGYVDADLLVTAQTPHQIAVVGPPWGSYSQHHKNEHGDALQAFRWDGDAQQAHCPPGHASVNWRPGRDVSGDPVIRIRFDRATCRACPLRWVCTSAKAAPRHLTVRPQAHHEALQAARHRQATAPFNAQ
jgi:transposase